MSLSVSAQQKSSLKEGNVTLVNLRAEASGRYRCEVSLEAPTFETFESEANLTVIGKYASLCMLIA